MAKELKSHVCHECKSHYYVDDPEWDSGLAPPELCGRCKKHPEKFQGWTGVGFYIHIEKQNYDSSPVCNDFELDPEKTLKKQMEKDAEEYAKAVSNMNQKEKNKNG